MCFRPCHQWCFVAAHLTNIHIHTVYLLPSPLPCPAWCAVPGVAPLIAEGIEAMLRMQPVSKLRQDAAERRLDTSSCIEKEDLVQLLKAAVLEERAATAAGQSLRGHPQDPADAALEELVVSDHADLSAWSPMALFLQAEGNMVCVGRTYQVQDMLRAAVAAARGSSSSSSGAAAVSCPGDELYGWLAAWNLLMALACGGSPFRLGEVLEVLAWAYAWKDCLKPWGGDDMLMARIQLIAKPVLKQLKVSGVPGGAAWLVGWWLMTCVLAEHSYIIVHQSISYCPYSWKPSHWLHNQTS